MICEKIVFSSQWCPLLLCFSNDAHLVKSKLRYPGVGRIRGLSKSTGFLGLEVVKGEVRTMGGFDRIVDSNP